MPPRKRKRLQLFPDAEETFQALDDNPDINGEPSNDKSEKERNVWEVFREEHFEAIEQMPLNLHRQYALMQELDQQATSYIADLLPMLQEYISSRQDVIPPTIFPLATTDESDHPPIQPQNDRFKEELAMAIPSDGVNPLNKTRGSLSHIAQLVDGLLRASEEKVNVAQAAHDSVDRHVRILEHAIKEQENSIGLGARPGHLAPSTLFDLVVPRWTRPSRVTLSPMDGIDKGGHISVQPALVTEKGGRNKRKGRPPRAKAHIPPGEGVTLTITLPAQPATGEAPEEIYCYCNQGSFGEMIGCDSGRCEREWYHLKCVGLEATPQGSWFCPDCRPP